MWILSYGSSGPDLDASKFREYREANLEVDECYTTTDHALKYTLVHLADMKTMCAVYLYEQLSDFDQRKYTYKKTSGRISIKD